MAFKIDVIRPSSRGMEGILEDRIIEFAGSEIEFAYEECEDAQKKGFWPYAGSPSARARQLEESYLRSDSQAIVAARGGYGASDLLDCINWDQLKKAPEKPFVGFSDISALNSALWVKAGKRSIHGPMPATTLWNQEGDSDTQALLGFLTGSAKQITVELREFKEPQATEGWLFGGCLSVLTNLIGTPYFPASLEGAILFLEDTGENPFQIMRHWNQWVQSGATKGLKGVILGTFSNIGDDIVDDNQYIAQGFYDRHPLPIWTTDFIGHVSPNIPMGIGYNGRISQDTLTWGL